MRKNVLVVSLVIAFLAVFSGKPPRRGKVNGSKLIESANEDI